MIQVVNKRTYEGEGDGEYIGRPSVLGNPFSHIPGSKGRYFVRTRREAIDAFKDWFVELSDDSPQKKEFDRLKMTYRDTGQLTLICWCAPSDCHGHVLADLIYEELEKDENAKSNNEE